MKFNSAALPLLPTPQQLHELSDALISAQELYQLYIALEQHERVQSHAQLFELFNACQDQVIQDIIILGQHIEQISTLTRLSSEHPLNQQKTTPRPADSTDLMDTRLIQSYGVVPDLQRPNVQDTVYNLVKQSFSAEEFLLNQLRHCLKTAQNLKQLKLELQLKMAVLSAEQRYKLLQNQYGFSPGTLLSDLSRTTTKLIFGALDGIIASRSKNQIPRG